MTHKRIEIRNYLKDLFANDIAPVKNIFTSREQSINSEVLPAITIFTPEESATPRNLNAKQFIRTLTIKIEVRPEVNAFGPDESADLMMKDVEDFIFEDPTLGGLVYGLVLTSSVVDVDLEVEKPVSLGVLTFECQYFT